MYSLNSLPFNNRFAALGEDFLQRVSPTALENPFLIHFNTQAAALIGLENNAPSDPDFLNYFSGAKNFAKGDPVAMLYSGHQFGYYNPQLGDGRAIMLGEVSGSKTGWELQLKGSGQTAYSRHADGRAVLRSTIREYLCSEAMQGLGIPTTRALCMVGSEEVIHRETLEMAAMMVRMAPSHVRFGSFEIFFYRRQHDLLKQLADFMLEHHFVECLESKEPYLAFLQEVITRTAKLVAQWQLVGFAHGVMNTDNMSVLGLTLDYGPFGFLDKYNPDFICNHSDHQGRYVFHQQPQIGLWNLNKFAQALLPLLDAKDPDSAVNKAQTVLATYQQIYLEAFHKGMNKKLGLLESKIGDDELVATLLSIMATNQVDYTIFFRKLSQLTLKLQNTSGTHPVEQDSALRNLFLNRDAFDHWVIAYRKRLEKEDSDDEERAERMNTTNPKYILRNYMAQVAIEKAQKNDFSEINTLMKLLQAPFNEHLDIEGGETYADHPPSWAEQISVSCSS